MICEEILQQLETYCPVDSQDARTKQLLSKFVHSYGFADLRLLVEKRLTCSAWIVNELWSHVLLIYRENPCQWCCPGGNPESNDLSLVAAARRYAGDLLQSKVIELHLLQKGIFDLEVQEIVIADRPTSIYQFDIRFLFSARGNIERIASETPLLHGWFPLKQVEAMMKDESLRRLIKKTFLRNCPPA